MTSYYIRPRYEYNSEIKVIEACRHRESNSRPFNSKATVAKYTKRNSASENIYDFHFKGQIINDIHAQFSEPKSLSNTVWHKYKQKRRGRGLFVCSPNNLRLRQAYQRFFEILSQFTLEVWRRLNFIYLLPQFVFVVLTDSM